MNVRRRPPLSACALSFTNGGSSGGSDGDDDGDDGSNGSSDGDGGGDDIWLTPGKLSQP